jgi:hypothetical protein
MREMGSVELDPRSVSDGSFYWVLPGFYDQLDL